MSKVKWNVAVPEAIQAVAAMQEAADLDKSEFRILDVGGAIKPLVFATHVIDILPHENRAWYGHIPGEATRSSERFSVETWVQQDICVTPWPYEDDYFDVIWCTQTVEDVRDPLVVIKEMSRVGKVGYLDTIHRNFESLINVESPHYAGYVHHRWLIVPDGDKLKFTFKFPQLHTLSEYRPIGTGERNLSLWWTGEVEAYEYIPMSIPEIDDYLLNYVEETQKTKQLQQ